MATTEFLAKITLLQQLGQPVDPGYGVPAPPAGLWPPGSGIDMPSHPIVLPPENPGQPPVVIWPDPGYPAHPIAPGGPPPGVWPPPVYPAHPIAPGGSPPAPAHPIVLPPMIWPEPPDGGPPIAIDPGHPEHPIVIPTPPGTVWPPDVSVEHPIVLPLPPEIWPNPGHPAHPIVLPPTDPDRQRLFTWKVGWSEQTGWVVVAIPNFPTPTPSAAVKTSK
jgi:hypothetical protein